MQRSETIGAIAKALAAFNSEVSKISKDAANPFFKNNYATLDNIIDGIRPVLSKNGLTVMQFPSSDGQNIQVTTYLAHESGEWIESEPLVMRPVKNDPQGMGSAITYARRYSLQSVLSLNTGEDDDGNAASHAKPQQQKQQQRQNQQRQTQQRQQQEPPPQQQADPITDQQLKALNTMISRMETEKGIKRETTKKTLAKKPDVGAFESTKDLTVSQAMAAMRHLSAALGDK